MFRLEPPSVPPTRVVGMGETIELGDGVPVHRKQYPLSAAMGEAIQAWILEMVAAKIIIPSNSPYCAAAFCARKANGDWRIVHDFRGINAKIRVSANPILRKDDIYRAMARGWVFSVMDPLWGFYQVRLRDGSIPYTAFATPDGLFEYLGTPMGDSSSPS
ncbi:hypothetical protein PC121_g8354 [Phytophthora cactorum]|nr:hypothetical protein PC120_g23530 [Phytophthora cactorum]KAG3074403.1 hypothetical protein PC121_g8354 [Phytophthora cactorum]KAG4040490.1 hypothetical protein PC123_g23977 [Phytophthora cactorum]